MGCHISVVPANLRSERWFGQKSKLTEQAIATLRATSGIVNLVDHLGISEDGNLYQAIGNTRLRTGCTSCLAVWREQVERLDNLKCQLHRNNADFSVLRGIFGAQGPLLRLFKQAASPY